MLTANAASLLAVSVLKLEAVAQDGVRVHASAGAGSFRREAKLAGYLEVARQRVAALKAQVDDDPGVSSGGGRRRTNARLTRG